MSRLLISVFIFLASFAQAQEFSGLARVDAPSSTLSDSYGTTELTLSLSQGVPWRVFTLDEPRRLVLDFSEVDWTGLDAAAFDQSDAVQSLRFGTLRPGWSRLVADLATPKAIASAEMKVDEATGRALLHVKLRETDAQSYAQSAGAPYDARWDLPKPAKVTQGRAPKPDDAPTVIVIDPGHGGVDPGAERGKVQEKNLMLTFAREIRDTLRRSGDFEVILTRDSDVFVSLEGRVALAHEVQADVFISLHADVIQKGHAHGATVYTLSRDASDAASQYLAERHDRTSVLVGIDLSGTDDLIANVLLDLARQETAPRSQRLAEAMVLGMKGTVGKLNNKPYRQGAFSVLKAADIPSVLIEVGFMSSDRDLANLQDQTWRTKLAEGIRDGLQAWVIADKAAHALSRQ